MNWKLRYFVKRALVEDSNIRTLAYPSVKVSIKCNKIKEFENLKHYVAPKYIYNDEILKRPDNENQNDD